jgi:3'(2'), 5'-bisphosphate nucleotidase
LLASLEGETELVAMGSSLKLCLVAEGAAHLYPRLGPTSEWDTGAAQAVVEAAGGKVTIIEDATDALKADAAPLRYNQKESVLNPYFLVSC